MTVGGQNPVIPAFGFILLSTGGEFGNTDPPLIQRSACTLNLEEAESNPAYLRKLIHFGSRRKSTFKEEPFDRQKRTWRIELDIQQRIQQLKQVLSELLTIVQSFEGSEELKRLQTACDEVAAFADQSDGRIFSRSDYPAHVTVSACLFSWNFEQMVLLKHKKLGIWVQPGGHLEPHDENLQYGAWREAFEETGQQIWLDPLCPLQQGGGTWQAFDLDIHSIPACGHEPEHKHLDLRFALRCPKGTLPLASDGAESDCVLWVSRAELAQYTQESSVRRLFERASIWSQLAG